MQLLIQQFGFHNQKSEIERNEKKKKNENKNKWKTKIKINKKFVKKRIKKSL